MLDKFKDRDDLDNRNLPEGNLADRETLIRERMQARGITEEEATRLVLSEEELRVGKRSVEAGEVGVHKHVETRHVHEEVPLRHEEVEVERRPITDGYTAAGEAFIGKDEEIRVPLRAEEAVVEKRVVPKEELVVKKREVTETETVEADLRRERAEVDREVTHRNVDVDVDGRRNDRM